ncbi:MAG: hypothetical protein JNM30_13615 [Rhodospirillales bacterium]|nr:hypothetical protein [Rhodospirillales bacterium]
MEAIVKQHPAKGKGWAVITLTGDGVPSAGVTFQLRRSAGRDAILGPNGWQATELFLEAAESAPAPGGVALTVGPEVVNHMDTANYLLLVMGDGVAPKQPLQTGLAWRNIAQLDLGRGKRGGVAVRGESEAAARVRGEAPKAEPQPQPAEDKAGAAAAEPIQGGLKGDDGGKKKGNTGALVAAVVALLVLGGGGAWFFWPKPPAPDPGPPKQEADAKPKDETKPPDTVKPPDGLPPPPLAADDIPADAEPLKFARDKLQAGIDAGPAVAFADKLMARPPAGIDAAFLLYRAAAQKGDAGAAVKLARLFDPADQTPSGSLKKSADSAFDWYRQAAGAQHPDAAGGLARLKAWVEQQAGTGDADAQRVMKRFAP